MSDALAQRMTCLFTDPRPKILEACGEDICWVDMVRENSLLRANHVCKCRSSKQIDPIQNSQIQPRDNSQIFQIKPFYFIT